MLFKLSDLQFMQDASVANEELLRIIHNGGSKEFGIFYNSLVYSENTDAAKLLRQGIDNDDIEVIDGEEFYKVS
jgi:hypothetical protein